MADLRLNHCGLITLVACRQLLGSLAWPAAAVETDAYNLWLLLLLLQERAPAAPAGADAGAGAAADKAAAGGAVIADEAGVRVVTDVTDDQPVETFAALLKHGQIDKAFSGMQVGCPSPKVCHWQCVH